MYFYKSSRI